MNECKHERVRQVPVIDHAERKIGDPEAIQCPIRNASSNPCGIQKPTADEYRGEQHDMDIQSMLPVDDSAMNPEAIRQ